MAINPTKLARAVSVWLEFEALAGREDLIDEGYLATPITQHLKAEGHGVMLEKIHPGLGGNNRLDFATRRTARSVKIRDAIETKLVNGKRSMVQEIYTDLARLENLTLAQATGDRWLLVAGMQSRLAGRNVFRAVGKRGARKLRALRDVVRMTGLGQSWGVDIANSQLPHRRYWLHAQNDAGGQLPDRLKVKLAAIWPPNPAPADFACYVWLVSRIQNQNRQTHV